MRQLKITHEVWPIAGAFSISRGSKTEAHVVLITICEDGVAGRGECVPYARNGESVESVTALIETLRARIETGIDTGELQTLLPAGAARNAVDCALVDLKAKRQSIPARALFDLPAPNPVVTARTISLAAPEDMAASAAALREAPLLKVKLGGAGDERRIAAVRAAAPESRLIVDANEAWTDALLAPLTAAALRAGVELIEQPLPAASDASLRGFSSPVPYCADESCRDRASLAALRGKYRFVNIKLDKAGGITEAVAMTREARAQGFGIMLGCMVATSLAMAPIAMLAPLADYIDLDGPLLLERDRPDGITYDGLTMRPPPPRLWG